MKKHLENLEIVKKLLADTLYSKKLHFCPAPNLICVKINPNTDKKAIIRFECNLTQILFFAFLSVSKVFDGGFLDVLKP